MYQKMKVADLSPKQQEGTKQLSIAEVKEYLKWLDEKGGETGTVNSWQVDRVKPVTIEKAYYVDGEVVRIEEKGIK
jgi:hypothetical protein